MAAKSDRLKKFQTELKDLEEWLKLGLVPKKDIEKHTVEIEGIKKKIQEEEKRLLFLKETGELEEYVTPRKQQGRSQYTETPTMPEMDMAEEPAATTETTETTAETTATDETESESVEETFEEEDPFSDKNRWKRGMLSPDQDEY